MNSFKWLAGLFTAYLLLSPDENAQNGQYSSNSAPDHKLDTKFSPPVQPIIIRNDGWGKGHFHASRRKKDGTTYLHSGLDLICSESQRVFSPINGKVIRYSYPYSDQFGFADKNWKGVLIAGTGEFSGYLVWLWYFRPFAGLVGSRVNKGDYIGQAQAISKRYGSSMKDHLHLQVKRNGHFIDPLPFLQNVA